MVDVRVRRLSNSDDIIPLMISERLIDVTEDYTGEYIMASGQFRSYNRHEEQKNRLVLSVFVREVSFVDEEPDGVKTNSILLDGYICKEPIYRKTPLGKRLQMCCLQSTALTESQITFHVSVGEGMQDMLPDFRWENMSRFLEESRAESI